ncbi:MAG: hypothetical protein JEZ07_10425 [Phycisphaerae bacterium]|nr:hypothetical protein [Phycisphaerae bacterium]
MKKILLMAMAVVLLSTLKVLATGIYANSDDPLTDGSLEHPYEIATAEHFLSMNQDLGTDEMLFFKITADIDLAGMGDNPDGSFSDSIIAPVSGPRLNCVIFGCEHIISNARIDNPEGQEMALFGKIHGFIYDLGIENIEVNGRFSVAGLAWDFAGKLNNCYITGKISADVGAYGVAGTFYESDNNYFPTNYSAMELESRLLPSEINAFAQTPYSSNTYCDYELAGKDYGQSTTSNMQNEDYYKGWEFTDFNTGQTGKWFMPENSYPVFASSGNCQAK